MPWSSFLKKASFRSHPKTCDGIRLALMAFTCVDPPHRSAATTLRRLSLLKAIRLKPRFFVGGFGMTSSVEVQF